MIFQRLDDVGNTDDDGDDDECYNCKSSKCMTAPTPLGSIVCRVCKELFVQTKLERESRNMYNVLLKESESKSLINCYLCKDLFVQTKLERESRKVKVGICIMFGKGHVK